MFGPARIGVLKSHTGCVETTRPRGVLGQVKKKKKKFGPSGVGVLERHIGCVETTRPREKILGLGPATPSSRNRTREREGVF